MRRRKGSIALLHGAFLLLSFLPSNTFAFCCWTIAGSVHEGQGDCNLAGGGPEQGRPRIQGAEEPEKHRSRGGGGAREEEEEQQDEAPSPTSSSLTTLVVNNPVSLSAESGRGEVVM